MKDIVQSLNNALINQGWIFADKLNRIGHPFVWVDGDNHPAVYGLSEKIAALQFLTMLYEKYPTPDSIKSDDFDKMYANLKSIFLKAYNCMTPFDHSQKKILENSVDCNALVRTQDYSFIKKFCTNLPKNVYHLDIGPGFGGHCAYSLNGLNGTFYALEASPHSYMVQRQFFNFLKNNEPVYLDVIDCETLNLNKNDIKTVLNNDLKYRIKHVPSWYFDSVNDNSIDLITATWVLNEISVSGILWLISHSIRVLKKGGYVYLRDSGKLKPLRHPVNYDELLIKLGFEEVYRYPAKNRVDYHGIPRAFQKMKDFTISFEELVDMVMGKFAITIHGGAYMQNLPESK